MAQAYLLINTAQFEPQLMETLRKMKGVEEAYAVYGVHDIILKTKADTMKQIKGVHDKIRKQKNVRSTITMFTHEE